MGNVKCLFMMMVPIEALERFPVEHYNIFFPVESCKMF